MQKLLANIGSYLAERDFFDQVWRGIIFGSEYARLVAVKDKYGPDGLFFVHRGVGTNAGAPTTSRN
ncbi:MAG: BBE domain-containing protein [Verrucomicrobia bacterium]|nr:BBE domain-containing protein [Verrucomicrobiota bacterium]